LKQAAQGGASRKVTVPTALRASPTLVASGVAETCARTGQTDERVPLNRRYAAVAAETIDLGASDDQRVERRSELMLAVHRLTRILEREFL
jgi:hypothetical protein